MNMAIVEKSQVNADLYRTASPRKRALFKEWTMAICI